MVSYINPNSCNKIDCFLVFNNPVGTPEYDVPSLLMGQLTLFDGTHTFKVCWEDILCGGNGAKEVCTTTGTPQQNTITIVKAPSDACCGNFTTYTATFVWPVACGQFGQINVEVVGNADSGDTTSTIATKLAAAIQTFIDNGALPLASVTPSGAVVTVVAIAAGVELQVSVGSNVTGAITTAITVPNVNPFGNPADLIAMGVPSSLLGAGATYNAVAISYWWREDSTSPQMNVGSNANVNGKVQKLKTCWVFVQDGGTAEGDILTDTGALEDILSVTLSEGFTVANYLAKQTTFCVS